MTTVKEFLENLDKIKAELKDVDPNTPIKYVSVDSGGYTDSPEEVGAVKIGVQQEEDDSVLVNFSYQTKD